jgi:hypothetical protein
MENTTSKSLLSAGDRPAEIRCNAFNISMEMQETPEGNAKACFQERVLLSKTKVDLCKEK